MKRDPQISQITQIFLTATIRSIRRALEAPGGLFFE
jgi:hypothetical protein